MDKIDPMGSLQTITTELIIEQIKKELKGVETKCPCNCVQAQKDYTGNTVSTPCGKLYEFEKGYVCNGGKQKGICNVSFTSPLYRYAS